MHWIISSRSGGGNCIEVGAMHDSVIIRDTKDMTKTMLILDKVSWSAFISKIKNN